MSAAELRTTGPVGKPLGEGKSGLHIVNIREPQIERRYHDFGELPNLIDLDDANPERPASPIIR